MDFTLYWFMFPVSILVATCAMLSGIGGAALFALSDLGAGVTGEVIYVDGGYHVMGMATEDNLRG